jgi:tetratricopeptide (TPR) repeat protein
MKDLLVKKIIILLISVALLSCSSTKSILTKNASDAYYEGKYLTSLFFAEQALLENPEDAEALLLSVKCHLKLEEYPQALNKLEKLQMISNDPEILFVASQVYIGLEDHTTALLYLEKYLNHKSEVKNKFAYINAAYCHYQLNNYDKALSFYQQYASRNPNDVEAYLNIGNLFGYLGQSDSAIKYYSKVLELDSTNYNALYNRSVEYLIQKKVKLAGSDLELLSKYYPNDINVLIDLAKVRKQEKRYFAAINELTKAIEIDSTVAEAFFLRGRCFKELGRRFSACLDFIKAGELGHFEAYEMIKVHCSKNKK